MSLPKNSKLIGLHAFLSPSTYQWIDYDEEKLRRVYFQKQQARLGDEYHAYAQRAIDLKIRQADNGTTLSMYINDAIGFRMQAEVSLFYSEDCFGTTDSISCREEKWPDGIFDTLRISDLKTGVTPASMKQLLIYAGIFFHEYRSLFDPRTTRVVLRIYQNDAIEELMPDTAELLLVMSRVKTQADLIKYLREED
jgi:hypothetical protein